MVTRIYGRYGGKYQDTFDDVGRAISCAQAGAEAGEDYTVAIYDTADNKLFIPDMEPIGVSSGWREKKVKEFLELDAEHQFAAIGTYSTFLD